MNQQMNLLEARAMAREREHQLQLDLRSRAAGRRHQRQASARRLVASLGRHRAAQEAGGRSTRAVTARG